MFNKQCVDENSGKTQPFNKETQSEFIIPNYELNNSHEKKKKDFTEPLRTE